jgi:hypothetical protein
VSYNRIFRSISGFGAIVKARRVPFSVGEHDPSHHLETVLPIFGSAISSIFPSEIPNIIIYGFNEVLRFEVIIAREKVKVMDRVDDNFKENAIVE